jgi:hypothetical protein
MRGRILAIGVGVLAVVVIVGLLNSGRSGGDMAELVDRLEGAMEEQGIPKPLVDCTGERLEAAFDDEEIEKLYDSRRGQSEGTVAVVADPAVKKELKRIVVLCALQLERSGQYNREDLIRAVRGLAHPS